MSGNSKDSDQGKEHVDKDEASGQRTGDKTAATSGSNAVPCEVESAGSGRQAAEAKREVANPTHGDPKGEIVEATRPAGELRINETATATPTNAAVNQPYKPKPAKPRFMGEFFASLPQTVFIAIMFHAFMHGSPRTPHGRGGPASTARDAQNMDLSQGGQASQVQGMHDQRRMAKPNVRHAN
jgi:hypothetical protein